MHLHKDTLAPQSFELLKYINSHPDFQDFYLAGGTSLSLQIGHRESIDLDFFTDVEFSSNLIDKLDKDYSVISMHNNSIEVIIDNTKVFFFYFAFPRRNELQILEGIRFAHTIDIGLMKLLALQGRNTRKDLIDLFFIDQEIIPLEKLVEIFQHHYPKERFNTIDSIKTLIDNSIESQPMPMMHREFDWERDSKYIIKKLVKVISKVIL